MFYLYILKSKKTGRLYIGFSSDLKDRIEQHNLGLVKSTKYNRPYVLVYYESYSCEEEARHREKNLKLFSNAYFSLKRRIKKSIDEA